MAAQEGATNGTLTGETTSAVPESSDLNPEMYSMRTYDVVWCGVLFLGLYSTVRIRAQEGATNVVMES